MNFVRLFLSFRNRVGRTVYMGGLIVNVVAVLIVFAIANSVVLATGGHEAARTAETIARYFIALPLSFISVASLHARRLHDQGQIAWWVVPTFAVFALCGWWAQYAFLSIAEGRVYGLLLAFPAAAIIFFLLFLFAYPEGQHGPNQFGPDPREEDVQPQMRTVRD